MHANNGGRDPYAWKAHCFARGALLGEKRAAVISRDYLRNSQQGSVSTLGSGVLRLSPFAAAAAARGGDAGGVPGATAEVGAAAGTGAGLGGRPFSLSTLCGGLAGRVCPFFAALSTRRMNSRDYLRNSRQISLCTLSTPTRDGAAEEGRPPAAIQREIAAG